tara:strand:+ start:80 stop:460 length:381 start_codon:yes stop_codon:yes gene_type:complete
MIRIGNKCISSTMIVLIIALVFIATMAIASIMNSTEPVESSIDEIPQEVEGVWIPTPEDIQYQDSMWTIINETQKDVDIIKEDIEEILYKLDRIEYEDGTWDSVRIPIESDEYRMWITGEGDTIWE